MVFHLYYDYVSISVVYFLICFCLSHHFHHNLCVILFIRFGWLFCYFSLCASGFSPLPSPLPFRPPPALQRFCSPPPHLSITYISARKHIYNQFRIYRARHSYTKLCSNRIHLRHLTVKWLWFRYRCVPLTPKNDRYSMKISVYARYIEHEPHYYSHYNRSQ